MRRWKKATFIILAAWLVATFGIFTADRASAEYPNKPITMLCSHAAGGSIDSCTRALASEAEKVLGQPVVVQQKTGGMGGVGLTAIAGMKPDGYTLLSVPSTSIIQAAMLRKANFKPLGSFTPILGYGSPENAMLVLKDAKWKSFKEFMADAKANPGKLKYSSPGSGSIMHLAMLYIAKKEGIKWVHVPFKGTNPAYTALLGGHVDAGFTGALWVKHVRAGTVRALMTLGEERNKAFPDVPTIKENGIDFSDHTVFSVVGPAGMDEAVVAKIDAAFKKAWEGQKFQDALKKFNMTPKYYDSKGYKKYLEEEWEYWGTTLKDLQVIKKIATEPR